MKRFFIIGYMGCGKTHFGRKLAQKLHLRHIDLDHFIENRYHKSVSELFKIEGEESFRNKEHACLKEVSDYENVVISTGGGTPCYHNNLEYMKGKGEILFIHLPIDILCERLLKSKNKRPLIENKNNQSLKTYIENSLTQRMPYYLQADTIIEDSDHYLKNLD